MQKYAKILELKMPLVKANCGHQVLVSVKITAEPRLNLAGTGRTDESSRSPVGAWRPGRRASLGTVLQQRNSN